MVKVSKTKHITKKGVVKKNPTKKIIIKLMEGKDWKESWSPKQIMRAAKEAQRINGHVIEIGGDIVGNDSDYLIVFKGVSQKTIEALTGEYMVIFDKTWSANSLPELKNKLNREMEKW